MKLLVTTSRSLLLFDSGSGGYRTIHQGSGLYYGITRTFRHYLVAARGRMVSSAADPAAERGRILIFNRRLEPIGDWQAPFALRDIHEIRWHRRHLYVTCSHDNMVAIRTPAGEWQQWYPLGEPQGETQNSPRDRNHFNSLYLRGRTLWLLAHNRGPSEILQFDLPSRTLIHRQPLGQQAHNLWRSRGHSLWRSHWHTCSSAEGAIVSAGGRLIPTGGFPRGVARLHNGWAVGISALAERSQRDYTSGQIALFDQHWQPCRTHILNGEGLVLDILPLTPARLIEIID